MRLINLEEEKELQMDILKYVHDVCEKSNIDYYLAFGTLLGAIRHNGYIPWDDDIDIFVKEKDYDKLVKLINNGDEKYRFCDAKHDKKYPLSFGKIMNTKTVKKEVVDAFKDYQLGVNIDVFTLHNIDKDIYLKHKKSLDKRCFFYRMKTLGYVKEDGVLKNAVKKIIHSLFWFVSYNDNANSIKDELKECSKNGSGKTLISKDEYGDRIYDANSFDKKVLHKFEQYEFYVPYDYDDVLKRTFGDYMKLPPEKDRKSHHKNNSYIRE